MFDIPLSLHQSKTVCCLERCVLKKMVSCKRVSGRTVQLVKIVESSNKCAAEPHKLGKTRTNILDMLNEILLFDNNKTCDIQRSIDGRPNSRIWLNAK